jgi:CheY-like chemotaxis protein
VPATHRILVVDDNADLRDNLVECLELEGYQTAAAADGHQALALLRLDPLPHLVIIDMMMPGLSGLELAIRIRAEPRLSALRLIMATGTSAERDRLPVDEVLTKPFGVEELTGLLRRLLAA